MPDYDNAEAVRRSKLVEAKAAAMNKAVAERLAVQDIGVRPAPAPKAAKKKSADE